jgi:hypothetical protein
MAKFSSFLIGLIVLLCTTPTMQGATIAISPDDNDLDPTLRMPVRRLHPERPTAAQQREARTRKKEKKVKAKQADREEYYARLVAEKKGVPYLNARQRKARADREKAYLDSLLAIQYTVPDFKLPKRMTWIDDPIKESTSELLPYFNRNHEGDVEQYLPGDVEMGDMQNALFFYFNVQGSRPTALRLRGQYCADDPLGIDHVEFLIDGYDYSFKPTATREGTGGSRIYWENFDDKLSKNDKDLVYALAHCKWARVTYKSTRGVNHVKMLTDNQIKDFYRTLMLYRRMGGTL